MNRVTKRIAFGTGTIFLAVFSMSAQTNDAAAKAASAVLPLPEALRAGATVVSHDAGDKFTVLKKGTNDTVCIREPNEGQGRHYHNGKLKLPAHPTIGFQMGPLSGYNPATNSVSSQIEAWQMVIIPYATGATLSLPEVATKGMPWVMNSGAVMAHIMVEHDMAAMPRH